MKTRTPQGQHLHSLGDGLRELIASLGLSKAFRAHRAVSMWPRAVGDVAGGAAAGQSVAQQLQDGSLLVSIPNDAWRHRLGMDREALRHRLNELVGSDTVRSIRFTS